MSAAPSSAATLNTPRTAARSASRSVWVTRQSEVQGRAVIASRGGKVEEAPGCVLDQQRHDEVRKQPTAGEGLALGRQPVQAKQAFEPLEGELNLPADRKSTRLNSSHANISYAVLCLNIISD